jgi:catechol 2,3-dioxygenase-like lactoylglutathione lyase family enzyme
VTRPQALARAAGCGLRDNGDVFAKPGINLYTDDVDRLVAFYEDLGFRETFRSATHVELTMDGFTVGIASAAAAQRDHGFEPGSTAEIAVRTADADAAFAALTARGAPGLSTPHDFINGLRLAWVSDPDGNPVRIIQRRDD